MSAAWETAAPLGVGLARPSRASMATRSFLANGRSGGFEQAEEDNRGQELGKRSLGCVTFWVSLTGLRLCFVNDLFFFFFSEGKTSLMFVFGQEKAVSSVTAERISLKVSSHRLRPQTDREEDCISFERRRAGGRLPEI